MKDFIKKILREEFGSKEIRNLYWKLLSDENKLDIKERGNKIFNKFKSINNKEFNEKLKGYGLYYGPPDKEYIEKNIADIIFAINNIQLNEYTRKKLLEQKDFLSFQLTNTGRYVEYFQELPKSPEEKKTWSSANLLNDNIMVWMNLINNWLENNKEPEKNKSVSEIIKQYFEKDGGKMALIDLSYAIIDRNEERIKNITTRTWGGGQEVEKKFVTQLIQKKGFTQDDIHVFSGEKNIVDGVGIDLAVLCKGSWIPIQVKSDESEARKSIPYLGLSTFPSGDTFILVQVIQKNKIQIKLSEFCKPENVPVEDIKPEKLTKGTPPSNVDYLGWMEKNNKRSE
jgi:hypothetical protein